MNEAVVTFVSVDTEDNKTHPITRVYRFEFEGDIPEFLQHVDKYSGLVHREMLTGN